MPPLRLRPLFIPRVWGVRELAPFYDGRGREPEPIGETWLTANDCLIEPEGEPLRQRLAREGRRLTGAADVGEFPLLVKFLFPADRLSVQVHPTDEYAMRRGLGRGKTEMWHVVAAQPGARLGVNLRPGIAMAEFAAACRVGRGAECLDWQPAQTGDTFYIPAGTIHAIGPGMVLCEVQQQSDNTFRLDDYGRLGLDGRPRALHWEDGFTVARPHAGGGKLNRRPQRAGLLCSSPYFRVEKFSLERDALPLDAGTMHVIAALDPGLRLERAATYGTEPGLDLPPATCAIVPAASAIWQLAGRGAGLDITLPIYR